MAIQARQKADVTNKHELLQDSMGPMEQPRIRSGPHARRGIARRNEYIGNITVQPSASAKYLGVILDRRLRWREQVEAAVAKGTAATLAIARLTRPTFGLAHRHVRTLFRAVVIPRMEYALPVWCEPVTQNADSRRKTGSVGTCRQLGKVQRLAARLIAGGFRSTPTDMLDYHASLVPVESRVNLSLFKSTARLSSLPSHHPLYPYIKRCQRSSPRFHKSAMHRLFEAFPSLRNVEAIDAVPLVPYYTPPAAYTSLEDRDARCEYARRRTNTAPLSVHVLAATDDESNMIGAAAVSTHNHGRVAPSIQRFGPATRHSITDGCLVGAIAAISMISAAPRLRQAIILVADSAAFKIMQSRAARPGQYLGEVFHHELTKLRKRRKSFQLEVIWCPGYRELPWTKTLREMALQAATCAPAPPALPALNAMYPLPANRDKVVAKYNSKVRERWEAEFSSTSRGQRLATYDPRPPSMRPLPILQGLSRADASILVQLRTGHVGLNQYLARIQRSDSGNCAVCQCEDTVDHYLFHCRRFVDARSALRKALGLAPLNRQTVLSDPQHVKSTLKYVHDTGRFADYNSGV